MGGPEDGKLLTRVQLPWFFWSPFCPQMDTLSSVAGVLAGHWGLWLVTGGPGDVLAVPGRTSGADGVASGLHQSLPLKVLNPKGQLHSSLQGICGGILPLSGSLSSVAAFYISRVSGAGSWGDSSSFRAWMSH